MFVRFSLSVLILLSISTGSAHCAEDSAPTPTLKGGVKDRESLQPSVKVEVPSPAPSQSAHPLEGSLVTSTPMMVHLPPLYEQPPMIVPHPVPAPTFSIPELQPKRHYPTGIEPHYVSPRPNGIQSSFVGPNPNGLAHIPFVQPNFRYSHSSTRSNIMGSNCVKTYEPEYETRVVQSVPSYSINRLDSNLIDKETDIRMRHQGKQHDAKEPEQIRPLAVVAEPLPAVKATVAGNWDDWYKQVAKEVYRQWERAPVCPGKATVRVSVYNSRDVDSQIIDFAGLSADKADSSNQSAFCQAAIDSVDYLNRFQFWQFPANSQAGMRLIKFNIQFKREVGGKAGCEVSKTMNI